MENLEDYRNKIDFLDKEIIRLMSERFEVVKLVWEFKKANNMQALQAGRWQAVIDSRKEFAKELGLSPEFIEKIWNEIHDYSLSLEEKII